MVTGQTIYRRGNYKETWNDAQQCKQFQKWALKQWYSTAGWYHPVLAKVLGKQALSKTGEIQPYLKIFLFFKPDTSKLSVYTLHKGAKACGNECLS